MRILLPSRFLLRVCKMRLCQRRKMLSLFCCFLLALTIYIWHSMDYVHFLVIRSTRVLHDHEFFIDTDSYFRKAKVNAVKPNPESFWEFVCETREVFAGKDPADAIHLEILQRQPTLHKSANNIFLLETSCNPKPSYREWCSVESWAAQNREDQVWYTFTSPYVKDPLGLVKELLETHKNLKLVSTDLNTVLRKTPISDFFESLQWAKDTAWPHFLMSDLLRVALIYEWGGFYSDTDTICIKSTHNIRDSFGFQSKNGLASGTFHTSPNNEVIWKIMEEIEKSYSIGHWGSVGPGVFNRVMKTLCGKLEVGIQTCANITLLPIEAFFPVEWYSYWKMFQEGKGKDLEKIFASSYTIHFYAHLMNLEAIRIGRDSIYERAARTYCPITYKYAGSHSYYF